MNILYIEDNPMVREVTLELLSREDRQIDPCGSAEEALTAFGAKSYDLVITDISLPVMSGLDLARKLLADNPRLPIIIASGYVIKSAVEQMSPNVRSILKPFGVDEIDVLIGELTRLAA